MMMRDANVVAVMMTAQVRRSALGSGVVMDTGHWGSVSSGVRIIIVSAVLGNQLLS